MTVTKQPAVYTHTCDRCKTTTTSDDGATARELGWCHIVARGGGNLDVDLCVDCSNAFTAFMNPSPAASVGNYICDAPTCPTPAVTWLVQGIDKTKRCERHACELQALGYVRVGKTEPEL